MDLPTYTSIWRIEKRLYKLYDFRLPMPLPIGQVTVFAAVAVPYVVILQLLGLPFNHTLIWLYILPPGLVTWLATRPVLESKRLPELVRSQLRYLAEPKVICRMAPLAERDVVMVTGRVWRPRSRRADAAAAGVLAPGLLGGDVLDADVLDGHAPGLEPPGLEPPGLEPPGLDLPGLELPGRSVHDGPDAVDRREMPAGDRAFGQDDEQADAQGWPEPALEATAQAGRRRRPLPPGRLRARTRARAPERALADTPVPPPAAMAPAAMPPRPPPCRPPPCRPSAGRTRRRPQPLRPARNRPRRSESRWSGQRRSGRQRGPPRRCLTRRLAGSARRAGTRRVSSAAFRPARGGSGSPAGWRPAPRCGEPSRKPAPRAS